ncbi:hypothetical protein FB639_001877 [Coemansia asiatica]|nr:hypothetical protein FB639_001877 [Coemansia asiatica]
MLYDDRMQMPHPGGSWLRIRQPIDYVAPLKKPMNSFLLYSAERRVQLRQTHPDLNTTQQSTILAREWASLAEEEKEKYRAEAKQLRDDYNARRAELSLKLQQQLNQQHLNIGLAHSAPPLPPPPPGPGGAPGGPPRPPSQLASQQPSIDLLDVGIAPNNHEAHMHPVTHFGSSGFQQHFVSSGIQMPSSNPPPFTPATPSGGGGQMHGQTTPPTLFSQTPREDSTVGYSSGQMARKMADQFHFDSAISTLDPLSSTHNQYSSLSIEQGIQHSFDFGSENKAFGEEPTKRAIIKSTNKNITSNKSSNNMGSNSSSIIFNRKTGNIQTHLAKGYLTQ